MNVLAAVGLNLWLPIDVSAHGAQIDQLIVWTHWFMAVLFAGWGVYFIYCLVRFRSRPGHRPSTVLPKAKPSKYSEIAVVIVEAVLLLAFAIPTWARVRGPKYIPAEPGLEVRILAEQFAWNIHYPGKDGVFGRSHTALISAENPVGLDRSEPAAADDIVTINQLHIPVDTDVLVHLSSKDVIHSFSLPLLRIKQDVIPGISIPVWFKATKTTDQVRRMMSRTYRVDPTAADQFVKRVAMEDYTAADGTVILEQGAPITEAALAALVAAGIERVEAAPASPTEIACAQLCGLGHYRMRGALSIDTEAQYAAWLTEEEKWLSGDEDDEWEDE